MRESLSSEFDILGCSYRYGDPTDPVTGKSYNLNDNFAVSINGRNVYKRLFIKRKETI
jgi:hypothetical protein